MSPVHGWEDISYDAPDSRRLVVSALIPWLILVSLSSMLPGVYSGTLTLLSALHSVIATFLMFFITYYLAVAAFSFYMPSLSGGSAREQNNNTLILFSVCLLALIEMIKNCLPVDLGMLNFFPLYVLYIMWRGARYLKVTRSNRLQYVCLAFLTILLPPYILKFIFSLILP